MTKILQSHTGTSGQLDTLLPHGMNLDPAIASLNFHD